MEADARVDKKTQERTEGAATVVQWKRGDSSSAKRVQAGPTCSTSFGMKAEPPALPCRDDVLVENGAAMPKSCISPLEMRTLVAAGGLLPAGKASTTTRTTFDQPPFWFCSTEETNSRTSFLYASYYSIFGWKNNQQAPFWPRVNEKNRGKIWCSIPAGQQVVSTSVRFWERGARCFVRKSFVRSLNEAAAFFSGRMTRESSCKRGTELFNNWGGRGYDDSVPEEVIKTAPSGERTK